MSPEMSAEPSAEESPESDLCSAKYTECAFQFKDHPTVPSFHVSGLPDTPFTPAIVFRNDTVVTSIMSTSFVPEFINDDGPMDITNFGEPPFSTNQFVTVQNSLDGMSAVAHAPFLDGQLEFAKNRCVRLFFSQYLILFADILTHSTVEKIQVSHSEKTNNCVVFRTM